eukprot:GHVU01192623.1.p1 GENE.GHVU01192623.1~~GHVU01192623.1.p1  ORF type:complete len:311 (-),score=44.25 GHVU01192623.1:185-1117(-)
MDPVGRVFIFLLLFSSSRPHHDTHFPFLPIVPRGRPGDKAAIKESLPRCPTAAGAAGAAAAALGDDGASRPDSRKTSQLRTLLPAAVPPLERWMAADASRLRLQVQGLSRSFVAPPSSAYRYPSRVTEYGAHRYASRSAVVTRSPGHRGPHRSLMMTRRLAAAFVVCGRRDDADARFLANHKHLLSRTTKCVRSDRHATTASRGEKNDNSGGDARHVAHPSSIIAPPDRGKGGEEEEDDFHLYGEADYEGGDEGGPDSPPPPSSQHPLSRHPFHGPNRHETPTTADFERLEELQQRRMRNPTDEEFRQLV